MLNKLNHLWRVCGTGLGFVGFGLGGIAIGTVIAPMVKLRHKDPNSQEILAQRIIQKSFLGFINSLQGLGLMTYDVQGIEKLAHSHGELVVANHPTLIDVVMLIGCMPRANCVVKSALLSNPFTKGPVKVAGYVINQGGEAFIDACTDKLTRPLGNYPAGSLVIFPEGTRTQKGERLGDFQRGWANIAVRTQAPIRPVLITCTPSTLTKNEKWYQIPDRPFHLQLTVLDTINPTDIVGEDTSPKAVRKLNAWLYNFFDKHL